MYAINSLAALIEMVRVLLDEWGCPYNMRRVSSEENYPFVTFELNTGKTGLERYAQFSWCRDAFSGLMRETILPRKALCSWVGTMILIFPRDYKE